MIIESDHRIPNARSRPDACVAFTRMARDRARVPRRHETCGEHRVFLPISGCGDAARRNRGPASHSRFAMHRAPNHLPTTNDTLTAR
jgi:hypothetical protein